MPRTIIGIPGRWKDRSEIVTSIAGNSGGYIIAGEILLNTVTNKHFVLEIYEYDERLARAFQAAGRGRFSEADLIAINEHTYCLYVICQGGSFDTAAQMLQVGEALLRCGGMAVKVESSGIAHPPEIWRSLSKSTDPYTALEAYVITVGENNQYYSCGMHNLGLRDCVLMADISSKEAVELIRAFIYFLAVDKPKIKSGETFSVAVDAPRYRMVTEPCTEFAQDDPFHNPFGVWKLTPA